MKDSPALSIRRYQLFTTYTVKVIKVCLHSIKQKALSKMIPNSSYVVAQLSVATWAISIAAPETPFSTCTTPRSIACGLSGKPRTHLRVNTQSLVPAISLLPRPVPSSSYQIPSIWGICRQTDRARFEISSTRKRDHFAMNMRNLIAFVAIYIIFSGFCLCNFVMSLYGIEPSSGPSPENDDFNTKNCMQSGLDVWGYTTYYRKIMPV